MSEIFDTATTDRLLSTTRAVRRRLDLDRPVERDVLMDCIRLSMQAPTGSNRQGWRWVIVADPDRRRGLADLYRAGGAAYMRTVDQREGSAQREGGDQGESGDRRDWRATAEGADRGTQDGADAQQARVYASARYLMEVIDRIPVLVVPCLEGRVTDIRHAAAFFGSIHPAIWSFQLALRSRGLGSAWTTFHLAYEREAAEILGIPSDVTQAAMLPVAYTIGTQFKPARRRPVEEITYFDNWGATL